MPNHLPSAPVILAIIGLICIVASTYLAFQNPFGLWHWVLLLVAGACMVAVRRMRQ